MKKMIDKPVEDRFSCWIQDDHYSLLATPHAVVEEKRQDGEAHVHCHLPSGRTYELTLEGKAIPHLKSQRCTDGILLVEIAEGQWELHIIECKRTINKSKWKKTKLQFEATIQRSLGLLASVGVYPQKIKLYTAVRNDEEIFEEKNADPILGKMTLQDWRRLSDEEKEKLHYMDWFDQTIDIWVRRDVPHAQIRLDQNGDGAVEIQ